MFDTLTFFDGYVGFLSIRSCQVRVFIPPGPRFVDVEQWAPIPCATSQPCAVLQWGLFVVSAVSNIAGIVHAQRFLVELPAAREGGLVMCCVPCCSWVIHCRQDGLML